MRRSPLQAYQNVEKMTGSGREIEAAVLTKAAVSTRAGGHCVERAPRASLSPSNRPLSASGNVATASTQRSSRGRALVVSPTPTGLVLSGTF